MGADPLTAGILVGGQLLSSSMQSKAAKRAGSAQERAAQEAAQVQREALQSMRLATEPFRFGAQQSINPLLQSLGIQQIGLPDQPVFSMLTGEQTGSSERRGQIEARLEELRKMRGQL